MQRIYKNIQNAISKMSPHNRNNGYYVEVFYDMNEDEIYSCPQCSLGFNSWTVFHDPAVIKIANFVKRVSKKRLIKIIEERLEEEAEWRKYQEWLNGGMQHAN